jgi:NAD(P)-dependent dehydrogenase (short-subunit alcohol dehydrogenase family)
MQKRLVGKVALVTGAGKRLGRAVALRLAEEGMDVAVHYRESVDDAVEVVRTIEEMGQKAAAVRADLLSVDEIRQMVLAVGNELGRLDLLVNCAANFLPGSVISTTEEIWDASLDTNVKAQFFVAQAAAPMLRRSKGAIVNFSDTGGILGWPGFIGHSVAKAGMINLTKSLAKALAPEVRVNAIAPGTITMAGDPPEWEQEFVKLAPLKKSGRPSDIADAVVYLATADFLTGHTLVLDGGRTL